MQTITSPVEINPITGRVSIRHALARLRVVRWAAVPGPGRYTVFVSKREARHLLRQARLDGRRSVDIYDSGTLLTIREFHTGRV